MLGECSIGRVVGECECKGSSERMMGFEEVW